jgi:hypothetical protein
VGEEGFEPTDPRVFPDFVLDYAGWREIPKLGISCGHGSGRDPSRVKAICELCLDDIELGNRRITIAGRSRPLDELTREVLLEWLAYRSTRWPFTANPYLLVNHRSANGTGPVSTSYFAASALRRTAVALERLRVDRQLQEALAVGPDPLHLASVFSLDPRPRSAMRRTPGFCSSQPPKSKTPQARRATN